MASWQLIYLSRLDNKLLARHPFTMVAVLSSTFNQPDSVRMVFRKASLVEIPLPDAIGVLQEVERSDQEHMVR